MSDVCPCVCGSIDWQVVDTNSSQPGSQSYTNATELPAAAAGAWTELCIASREL